MDRRPELPGVDGSKALVVYLWWFVTFIEGHRFPISSRHRFPLSSLPLEFPYRSRNLVRSVHVRLVQRVRVPLCQVGLCTVL